MSSQAIGQRFRVSRGGCWQCLPDCRSRLSRGAEVSQVAYNARLEDVAATLILHDGPSERVWTESEVRAMKEAGEALDRKFIDLVAFASVHLPSKCLQELVDDWAGHDERAAWKEASKAT